MSELWAHSGERMYGMPDDFDSELLELIWHWRMKGASLDEIEDALERALEGAQETRRNGGK